MERPYIPELLAPAGSPDALRAAISAGADAAYLGWKRFGARQFATNFSSDELEWAVQYAHARKVLVYVTVNTLISDDELLDTLRFTLWLYEIGVDAILVQDAGFSYLIRQIIPNLPLHASTQMTIHNQDGVEWALKNNFDRVVLSRECTAEEIIDIGRRFAHENISLEIFAHGALCYCYSGQCLFSSMVGGRSGNRGSCAQPCRKPYTLVSSNRDALGRPEAIHTLPQSGRFILSPRDLAIYPYLDRITSIPVSSLKIEGRMKSPVYVAVVIDSYRRALDAIRSGTWAPSHDDFTDLILAYNREFTGGYLIGETGSAFMSPDRPDNRGLFIGKVISYDPSQKEAVIDLAGTRIPEVGDGIVFRLPSLQEKDVGWVIRPPFAIDGTIMRLFVSKRIAVFADVFLTGSRMLDRKVEDIMKRPGGVAHPIPIDLSFGLDDGIPVLEGKVSGPAGVITVRSVSPTRMEPAKRTPLSGKQIEELLRRTGTTQYNIRTLDLSYPGDLFTPLGEITRLRRDLLSRIEKALVSSYVPSKQDVHEARSRLASHKNIMAGTSSRMREPKKPVLSVYANTVFCALEAVSGGCDRVYFEPTFRADTRAMQQCYLGHPGRSSLDAHVISALREATDRFRTEEASLVWKWPRITRQGFIDQAIELLESGEIPNLSGIMIENIGAAHALQKAVPQIPLYGSTGLNVYNSWTASYLGRSVSTITLSPELTREEIETLLMNLSSHSTSPETEIIVQGAIELMISEDCLLATAGTTVPVVPDYDSWYGIRDEKGHIFPLVIDAECRTHIFNSVELCLIDHLPEIAGIGIDGVAIDARNRTGQYVREMVEIYRKALGYASYRERDMKELLEQLKYQIRKRVVGGITTGYYRRRKSKRA